MRITYFSHCRDIKDELRGVAGKAVIELLGEYDPQGTVGSTVDEGYAREYGIGRVR